MRNYEQLVINVIDALNGVYGVEISVMVNNKGWHIKCEEKPFKTCKNGKECLMVLETIFDLYKFQRGA